MSKPDAPTPPNPLDTARAATSTNVGTGVANAFLNNTAQNTPDGSLRYDVTGNYTWHDPTTNSDYNIPQFTATQSLSPQGQAIKAQTDAAKYNMAGVANTETQNASQLLSQPFSLNNAPTAGSAAGIMGVPAARTSFDSGPALQTQFGQSGDITQSYGPTDNFSADRQRVEDALMQRMNPQLALERGNIEQRLADQGIRYGSEAYNNAMMDYNRQANDARFGAIGQAGQEQQRMTQEAAAQAQFQNSAQQQGYEQQLGRGTFYNQAAGQQFSQNAAQGTFANAGLAQQLAQQQSGFNAQNAARNQYMQEQFAQRNQPINEITSLLSGSQVSQPNFLNTPGSQIATTDVGGLINNAFSQQMGIYQQQSNNFNSTMGGILGLGAGAAKGAAMMSDRREKKDIDRMATVFAADSSGKRKTLPIYQYSYKDDPASTRHVGPMAQDVERINPEHVEEHDGRKYIMPRHVMGSILRAA